MLSGKEVGHKIVYMSELGLHDSQYLSINQEVEPYMH